MTGRFELGRLPLQPWKNGAGRTREIAVEPPGGGFEDFDWRLSVAEIERDAPFSAFPGIDRCIVLWRGAGMRLRSADGRIDRQLDTPGEPFHFAGEEALDAQLLDGPSTDFNVMTRRGRWRCEVLQVRAPQQLDGADALLVLVAHGRWTVDGTPLDPGQGLLWRRRCTSLAAALHGDEPAPRLLVARLWRAGAP